MLIPGIILMCLGALLAWFGRPREQLLVVAGIIVFVIGVILIVLWALEQGDVETEFLVGAPSLLLLRKKR